MDCRLPGSSFHEILQARVLEWVPLPSPTSDQIRSDQSLSHVQLFVTPWTIDCQAPLSMGFSRQEYWSRLPCSSPGDLPDPGIEPRCPALQADSLLSEPPGRPYTEHRKLFWTYSILNSLDLMAINITMAG